MSPNVCCVNPFSKVLHVCVNLNAVVFFRFSQFSAINVNVNCECECVSLRMITMTEHCVCSVFLVSVTALVDFMSLLCFCAHIVNVIQRQSEERSITY